jgi:ABC-type antimicrobial peptide transport system permease subunit
MAALSGFFGVLAAILTAIGLHGMMAYMVVRRRSEIGIRMALGAPSSSILAMTLRTALFPVVAGLVLGLPLALAGGRVIAGGLYGVKSYDAVVLGTAVLVLVTSSIVAALLPARRAARIDPMVALRYE